MKQVTESKKKVKDQKTKGIAIEATWVVGIDIGKSQLSLAIMNKTQSVVHKFGVENSFAGHKKMLEKVKEKTKGNKVLYAMEPTGHYWMVLGQFFEDYNRQYVLIHPLAVARSREVVKLNRGKTDPLDAKLIGMLALRTSPLFGSHTRRISRMPIMTPASMSMQTASLASPISVHSEATTRGHWKCRSIFLHLPSHWPSRKAVRLGLT